ncbi:MAG: hypothetical protein INF48_02120 [Rhodobacter sp.]|nr:hypothetical protein [Rhodobacter sp.]
MVELVPTQPEARKNLQEAAGPRSRVPEAMEGIEFRNGIRHLQAAA